MVFDASQVTDSGYSLKNILAKGHNSMNRLVEVVLRWMMHAVGFHTDVRKMATWYDAKQGGHLL